MMCHGHKQKGVTFSELLITVAIIGILSAFAVPNMLSFIDNQRIKATANDIVTLINSAKTEAVKHNSPIAITAGHVKTNGNLNGTANSWTAGNAAISYQIRGRSIYGNIDYQANQDTQIANFKTNVKIKPESRLDSSEESDFSDDTNLILIAYPNGSMKMASLATKTANTSIVEGATVQIPVCIKKKCKDVIVAGNSRAYIGKPPVASGTALIGPPVTIKVPTTTP